MAGDPKLDLLHSIPLFERLGKKELGRLGQLADEIDVRAGRVLMRQGESGSDMFVIASGRVQVERDGRKVDEIGAGGWFGEMALLSEGTRTATVTATEPSRLFVVAHREFHELMREMPSVRAAVLDCVADRLRKVEADVAH